MISQWFLSTNIIWIAVLYCEKIIFLFLVKCYLLFLAYYSFFKKIGLCQPNNKYCRRKEFIFLHDLFCFFHNEGCTFSMDCIVYNCVLIVFYLINPIAFKSLNNLINTYNNNTIP